jgi:hypothetical protein
MKGYAATAAVFRDTVSNHEPRPNPSARGEDHGPVEPGDLTGAQPRIEAKQHHGSVSNCMASSAGPRFQATHLAWRQHLCWRSHSLSLSEVILAVGAKLLPLQPL